MCSSLRLGQRVAWHPACLLLLLRLGLFLVIQSLCQLPLLLLLEDGLGQLLLVSKHPVAGLGGYWGHYHHCPLVGRVCLVLKRSRGR